MLNKQFFYKIITIVVIIFSLVIGSSAQENNVLSWKPVYGAGGYVLEIRNSQKKIIVEKEITGTEYNFSKLSPGSYQYRLTTLNKIKKKGSNTGWVTLSIEKAVLPVLKNISQKYIKHSSGNPPLVVKGENFLSDTKLYLKNNSETIELKSSFISGNEMKVEFRSENKTTGVYDLVAVNRGGFTAVIPSAIEIVSPEISVKDSTPKNITDQNDIDKQKEITDQKAAAEVKSTADKKDTADIKSTADKKDDADKRAADEQKYNEQKKIDSAISLSWKNKFALGAGWNYTIPTGEWSSKLESSFLGFHLYASYPFSNVTFLKEIPVVKDFAIESVINYTEYPMSDAADKESFNKSSIYAGLNYPIGLGFISNSLYLIFHFDAGAAYTSMSIMNGKTLTDYASVDFTMNGGGSLRYRWYKNYFTDLSAEYSRVFYISHPLDEIKISIRAGVLF